jgi:exodeoxyribonuclease V alpha subunit
VTTVDDAPALAPDAGADLASSVALRATGLLGRFSEAGVLHAADVHVARRLGALCGEPDEQVLLALALTVRGVRLGSVRLHLADVAEAVVVDRADPEAVVDVDLPWPDPQEWLEALRRSPMVRRHGVDPGSVVRPLVLWDDDLWLERYWRMESLVAADLLRRAGAVPGLAGAEVEQVLHRLWPAPPTGDDVDADQRSAARTILGAGVSVLGGGPGTGKTTTVARVLCALRAVQGGRPPRVAVAAPSAKARNRIEESLAGSAGDLRAPFTDDEREFLTGIPAFTLHKLIGAYPSGNRSRHHAANPLPYDVVVLDETSMVSLSMFWRLLDALRPHARLVLVGDPDQLASVEAGAVLSDLDGLDRAGPVGAGVVRLATNRRVDEPELAELARAVREGAEDEVVALLRAGGSGSALRWHEVPDDATVLPSAVLDDLRDRSLAVTRVLGPAARAGDAATALRALDTHRLLCAHSRGPRGVSHWNAAVQRWVVDDDPESGARFDGRFAGTPVLVTQNDYENKVWNGDNGVVVAGPGRLDVVIGRGADVTTPVALTRLAGVSTMYAMTVYKSQGSEFDTLTLLLPQADSPLATRETFYTAVTRARREVLVIGSEAAVRACVQRRALRATGLGRRLADTVADTVAP